MTYSIECFSKLLRCNCSPLVDCGDDRRAKVRKPKSVRPERTMLKSFVNW